MLELLLLLLRVLVVLLRVRLLLLLLLVLILRLALKMLGLILGLILRRLARGVVARAERKLLLAPPPRTAPRSPPARGNLLWRRCARRVPAGRARVIAGPARLPVCRRAAAEAGRVVGRRGRVVRRCAEEWLPAGGGGCGP